MRLTCDNSETLGVSFHRRVAHRCRKVWSRVKAVVDRQWRSRSNSGADCQPPGLGQWSFCCRVGCCMTGKGPRTKLCHFLLRRRLKVPLAMVQPWTLRWTTLTLACFLRALWPGVLVVVDGSLGRFRVVSKGSPTV